MQPEEPDKFRPVQENRLKVRDNTAAPVTFIRVIEYSANMGAGSHLMIRQVWNSKSNIDVRL